MVYLELLFIISGLLSFACLILPIPILRFTLDKRIRKQLPADKVYDNYPDVWFGFGRTIMFAYASIFDRSNNAWQIKEFYNGFDIKSYANRFEKFLAYCFCFGFISIVGGGSVYIILEFFGLVNT